MKRFSVFILLAALLLPAATLLAQQGGGNDCGAGQQPAKSSPFNLSLPSNVEPTIPAPNALAAPDAPQPENPVGKTCENGRVKLVVTAGRHFGYRTGENVPLVVLLYVDKDVIVDVQSIENGAALFSKSSSYAIVGSPLVTNANDAGRSVYRIDITVRFWQPALNHSFAMNIRYAIGQVAGTNIPDWRLLVTPEFIVGSSLTVDGGQSLLYNQLVPMALRHTDVDRIMTPLGIALTLLPLAGLLALVLRRLFGRRAVPRDELAWRKLQDARREFSRHQYSREFYLLINTAMHIWFDTEQLDTTDMLEALKLRPDIERIKDILRTCDSIVYGHEQPQESEQNQIYQWVTEIIRP